MPRRVVNEKVNICLVFVTAVPLSEFTLNEESS